MLKKICNNIDGNNNTANPLCTNLKISSLVFINMYRGNPTPINLKITVAMLSLYINKLAKKK
jgi:hypothetical protein